MTILLGLDVSKNNIGVAICDAMQIIASPVTTITRHKFSNDIKELDKIIKQNNVVGVVIGMPVNMDGSYGKAAQIVKSFAYNLKKHFNFEIFFWDERMSTQVAEKMMLEMDLSRQKRAERIDKIAATYILQGFLDSQQKNNIL